MILVPDITHPKICSHSSRRPAEKIQIGSVSRRDRASGKSDALYCNAKCRRGRRYLAACGVNEAHVGMTATETITSNPRVLGADPLVRYQPAKDGKEEIPGGIGEEDIVYIVLPYIHSAREGVKRLGSLLEQYGTYEMNGIAFQDADEIWWLETIGGHHWIARKVPDDVYVMMPNQFGMDQSILRMHFKPERIYVFRRSEGVC